MPGDWGSVLTEDNNDVQYHIYDMLQNTRLMVDATGSVTHSMIYSAFGREIYNSASTSSAPMRQYQGELGYDRDLLFLNYARNRFVDVNKGRWINRDPSGLVNALPRLMCNFRLLPGAR